MGYGQGEGHKVLLKTKGYFRDFPHRLPNMPIMTANGAVRLHGGIADGTR